MTRNQRQLLAHGGWMGYGEPPRSSAGGTGRTHGAGASSSMPPGLLHLSDRGSQYTCQDYQPLLADFGIVVRMSRKADCDDNALMERYIGTVKTECVDRESYQTRAQARHSIFAELEVFYNRQRLHSSLGYVSPVMVAQHVK